MIWLTILIALSIPLAAVILDSPVIRAWADRRRGATGEVGPAAADLKALSEKVDAIEHELDAQSREIAQLKDSQQFFQHLLEDPAARQSAAKLPKPPNP